MWIDTHIINIIGTEIYVKINATNLDKSTKVIQATPMFCKNVIFFISLDTRENMHPQFWIPNKAPEYTLIIITSGKGIG